MVNKFANSAASFTTKSRGNGAGKIITLYGTRAPIDPKAGLAASTLYGQLKKFFDQCAQELEKIDEPDAQRLRAGSTPWRHTLASQWIARGTPVEIAQKNLGHSSLATTTVYVTTEQTRRMKAIQGGWQKGRVPE